ncbi:hypothetical protein V9T40_000577 [Parthenolecanium corni]|uniref:Uncharacterized protein n=1 Tax=Parthenolecanium corni TaxID=536013 RepID=A0AAN9TDL8_9HEMI
MTNKRRPYGERGSAQSGGADHTNLWPEPQQPSEMRRTDYDADDCDNRNPAEVGVSSIEPKARSGAPRGVGKVIDDDDDEDTISEEEEIVDDTPADTPKEEAPGASKGRHIHPCVCDLTKRQRETIEKHLHHKRYMQRKFEKRVKEIEEELERLEEERLERERELQEQQELFGDEYEVVGKKRKRKKRSARRASMVSLGVKQVINWKKEPRIEVKPTKASRLRKEYSSYCGRVEFPLSPIIEIDYKKEPEVAIRATVTSSARAKVNIEKKEYLTKYEDKRKIFEIPYYV